MATVREGGTVLQGCCTRHGASEVGQSQWRHLKLYGPATVCLFVVDISASASALVSVSVLVFFCCC